MGGRVAIAVNVAAFPEHFPREAIVAIFDAAAAVVAEAGGTIAGGHTIRNPEPIFGLAVQGVVHPDRVFRKGGAVPGDVLMLSKPIGRTRLFITKFISGLLFTALQVTVFALLAFLVIGIRGGEWEWGLFVVVPLMVVFFSYLFSVQAVVGMITRSPIASVIVTLLFWIFVFLIDAGERFTMVGVISSRLEIAGIEARMEKVEDEERKSGFTKRRDERLGLGGAAQCHQRLIVAPCRGRRPSSSAPGRPRPPRYGCKARRSRDRHGPAPR
jgi:hypothetical protein